MVDATDIVIDTIGIRGDGVGVGADNAKVFVPFALPGEVWQRNEDGALSCKTSRPDRAEPACAHFGVCGGCVAQHMPQSVYLDWKTEIVRQAFLHKSIDIVPEPLRLIDVSSRRRCVLTASDARGEMVFGYHRMRSHDLVALEMCPILCAEIAQSLAGLRQLAALIVHDKGSVRLTVLASDQGLDIDIDGDHRALSPSLRRDLARVAQEQNFARVCVEGDPVVQLRQPALTMSGVSVPVPSSVFVQATAQSEQVMMALVCEAARSSKRIADLFCGVGTFTFALAQRRPVVALDSDRDALMALEAARDGAQGLKPIEARARDLMREPLSRKELEPFDCVVFDPPRAGAERQAGMIAKSGIVTVVAVSCNPTTLARDSRILLDGGYEIVRLSTVDQFVYSAHVECVAVFRRGDASRRRR